MYGITKETQAESAGLYFSGGINENVELEKISYEGSKKDGTGDKVLAFHFKGPRGEQFRHVEWKIDETREDASKKFENLNKRIKHILTKFMTEEEVIIAGVSNFEEYCTKVISLAGNKFAGVKVRIKLVYNGNNLGFTKYLGFIERMDTTPSKIQVGKDEVIVRPAATPTPAASLDADPDPF